MNSREKILSAIKNNQPEKEILPFMHQLVPIVYEEVVTQFCTVVGNIGGSIVRVNSLQAISDFVQEHYQAGHNLVTTIDGIPGLKPVVADIDPHEMETVELALMNAVMGVAENGAVWLTEQEMKIRVLPFICQHLAVVLSPGNIVQHMHEAYDKIGNKNYGFSVFIAGPSKTADIEQSLVLGAHGPKSMTVFLLEN